MSSTDSVMALAVHSACGSWHSPWTHMSSAQSDEEAHALPPAQPSHTGPPQSMSVSSPFIMPSTQVGFVTHTPVVHASLVAQSAFWEHVLPVAHGSLHATPQSTSLSPPFLTPSLHDGASAHLPASHTWSAVQSVSTEHDPPGGHPSAHTPPLQQHHAQRQPQNNHAQRGTRNRIQQEWQTTNKRHTRSAYPCTKANSWWHAAAHAPIDV